nr:C39 family peptidase [Lactobacillus amylovorus]
ANAGWCVYNEPLYNVARKYTSHIENITGSDFLSLLKLVSTGHPVMIITTTTFNKVNNMQTWDTNTGKVNVTPSSHACVITGYSKPKKVVYVNNPYGYKNQPVNWKNLQASYNQQGRQALYIR